ncbi:GNAT family N-acetyltransferase [Thalassospira lucentensis]|uniref:GNAT family N-acetyltransferase n=1 Tax=Thalassospira lucentensis TaxID=168935 RepID=UPI002943E21F|nr:GNAT family N-acetyltransferase [Thalassospira lucentensis]WOI10107.1 GNAT family N-acetyltransferase [Thalassospira lucentensis]
MFELHPYDHSREQEWNLIVDQADNNHFMFNRAYMEYHVDRFVAASFVITQNDQVIGVIGGTRSDRKWVSHGGLTFGGLLLLPKFNRIAVISKIYGALWRMLREAGFTHAFVKPVPWIYRNALAEGEIYVLNASGEAHCMVEVSTAIDLQILAKPSNLRVRGMKKALKSGYSIVQSETIDAFWEVLKARLQEKYDCAPVHTLDEIRLLKSRFPDQIRLFAVQDSLGFVQGGTVIFETEQVAHAQYISATPEGMRQGALDLLFFEVIDHYRNAGKRYFDFGISTENDGKYLNEQLASFKEGFGGGSIVHHKFEVKL